MRALVTGSAGFLGRHLCSALRVAGWDVLGLDIASSTGDCRPFFRHEYDRPDVLFHCAATVGGREGIEYNGANLFLENLELDSLMFRYALRVRPARVVYFSSAAVYPTALQALRDRDCLYELVRHFHLGPPDAGYGWVKWTGEHAAKEVRKAGVPVTIVRPFSCYGPDQDECYPFRAMLERARRRDDPFVVWGDGQQVRDWIHINDIVAALLTLVEHDVDGPMNLGTGVGTSMDELARLMMAEAGYEASVEHLTDKPAGVMYRVADPTLLHTFHRPRIAIAEGVRRALA